MSSKHLSLLLLSLALLAIPLHASAQSDGSFCGNISTNLNELFGWSMVPDTLGGSAAMVMGGGLTAADRAMVADVTLCYPRLGAVPVLNDTATAEELRKFRFIILVGHEDQNLLAAAYAARDLNWTNLSFAGEPVEMKTAMLDDRVHLVGMALPRPPLSPPSPPPAIAATPIPALPKPVVQPIPTPPPRPVPLEVKVVQKATQAAESAFLLWLAMRAIEVIRNLFAELFLSFWRRGKKLVHYRIKGVVRIANLHIPTREAAAIALAAIVFGFGISINQYGFWMQAFDAVLAGIAISLLLFASQNLLRLVFCRAHRFKTEYHFWPTGSLFTLLTAYFGSMFSMTGYIVDEEGGAKAERPVRWGMSLRAILGLGIIALTFVFGLFFLLLYTWSPNPLLKMFMAACLLNSSTDLLPMAPMSGESIRKWSLPAYLAISLVVWGAYLLVSAMG